MEDTNKMFSALSDAGHLLTPDSLVRVLHMHSRRQLGYSMISEGETGCGKSKNAELYSLLINCDASIFTNIKLHLLAVCKSVAKFGLDHPKPKLDNEDEDIVQKINAAAAEVVALTFKCTPDELLKCVCHWVRQDTENIGKELGMVHRQILLHSFIFLTFNVHICV